MDSLSTISLESNSQIKINFDGGDLSSDASLLLFKDFAAVSSSSKLVNANRLLIHGLAYNWFNWFRRLALAASMRKQRIDTIRLKLLKIAARVVRSARYKYFKLSSSCPYKKEFYETLENIRKLRPQLE